MVTQLTQKSSKMKHNHRQTIGVNYQIRSNHKLLNSLECDASIIYGKVDITQEPKLHKIPTFDLIWWIQTTTQEKEKVATAHFFGESEKVILPPQKKKRKKNSP